MPFVTDRIELDKLAVVTLQGGGVYGLTLAGQLGRAINGFGIQPIAIAGTSAGAIVATLYWSGLSPEGIRNAFETLAENHQIPSLLGPFEPEDRPFDFDSLASFKREVSTFIEEIRSSSSVPFFERSIYTYLTQLLTKGPCLVLRHIRSIIRHVRNRGMFKGEHLETVIQSLMLSSPYMKNFRSDLAEIMSGDSLLRFKHIRELETRRDVLFPALFITASNVRTRKIEVFNSLDDKYAETPIARAARASGGFPFFFRPVQVETADSNDWYVDGGVISNFPVWIFGQEVRRKMAQSPRFTAAAQRPWMNVGLRRVPDAQKASDLTDPRRFLGTMFSLLTGGARDNLEELLASSITPSRIVRQPESTTGGPTDVLDVASISRAKVREMYLKGAWFARRELRPLSFDIPQAAKQEISDELIALVTRCCLVLGHTDNSQADFRSNLYLPNGSKLYRRFWVNMNPPSGHGFQFSSGLTGYCFSNRVPMVCNLESLRKAAEVNDIDEESFGMSRDEHLMVDRTRTWLLSIPVFDPNEFMIPTVADRDRVPEGSRFHHVLPRVLDGVIFGVMNLDARLDYAALEIDTEPNKNFTDPRVSAIIDLARVAAARIGRRLAICFGGKERSHATLS